MARRATRRYDSPLRRSHAEATRERLLDAAAALLARDGYAGATLEAVARRAGVALPTLYSVFGSKGALVEALVRRVKERVRLPERYRALLAEPDVVKKLALSAEITTLYSGEGWAVLEALRTVPRAETKLSRVWRDAEATRRRGQSTIVAAIAASGRLRAGLRRREALDVLWCLSSHETYRLYVKECGWTPRRFQAWLESTSRELLLGDSHG